MRYKGERIHSIENQHVKASNKKLETKQLSKFDFELRRNFSTDLNNSCQKRITANVKIFRSSQQNIHDVKNKHTIITIHQKVRMYTNCNCHPRLVMFRLLSPFFILRKSRNSQESILRIRITNPHGTGSETKNDRDSFFRLWSVILVRVCFGVNGFHV